MKLFSHIVAGIGMGSLVSLFSSNHHGAFLYTVILSFVINGAIDLGHTRIYGITIRSPSTHEVLNCIGLSLLLGSIIWIAIGDIYGVSFQESLIDSLLIAGSHLLGDLITRNGIYVRVGTNMLRISLSSYKYNDPVANLIYILILSLPLVISLAVMALSSGELPWYNAIDRLMTSQR